MDYRLTNRFLEFIVFEKRKKIAVLCSNTNFGVNATNGQIFAFKFV